MDEDTPTELFLILTHGSLQLAYGVWMAALWDEDTATIATFTDEQISVLNKFREDVLQSLSMINLPTQP